MTEDSFGDDPRLSPYVPLHTLKPLAESVWTIDGPVVRMPYGVGTLPFSTRTTVLRLPDGNLWVHSPGALPDSLAAEIRALGPVAWLIAPNRLHWLGLSVWQAAFPAAATLVAPGVERKAAKGGFAVSGLLDARPPEAWGTTIEVIPVPGAFMTEVTFFHHPSATLILTDLIENFETDHVHSRILALLMRLDGTLHPRGGTPRDLMLTFLPRRRAVRAAARRLYALEPRRIILSHGRCIETDAPGTLRRALAWTGIDRN